MAKVIVGDVTGTADITVGDGSLVGTTANLHELRSTTTQFVAELSRRIQDTSFQTATLGATFQSPTIALDAKRSLVIKAGVSSTITRYTAKDKALLGTDPTVPKIDIGSNDYWLSFGLQSTVEVGGTATVGSGFGVSLKFGSAVKLTGYTLFSESAVPLPTLGEAIGATLTNFGLLASSAEVRKQKPGTVRSADVAGRVTVSGSYSLPISVNQLALAESIVPFKFTVNPNLAVKVTGSVALTGEYACTCWRSSDTKIVLALLKKKGTTLTAGFTAGAGITAPAGTGDLIEAFFNAVAPGIDLAKSGLTKDDPRYKAINDVLQDSISRTFSASVNASCAASFSDQAALVYAIDLGEATDAAATATDKALDAALGGDWSLLPKLPNARELRNVTGTAEEIKFTFSVNLLGLFNYETVADFVKDCTIVHNDEDGSVTITDTATAKRITVASPPYLADADRLRNVLYEAEVITAAYKLAGGKYTPDFKMSQSLLMYKAKMSTADLHKNLRLAVLIGELTGAQLDAIPLVNPRHVVIDAKQDLDNDHLMQVFFADPGARKGHGLQELKLLGRRTLAALLDPADVVDKRRIAVLNDDAAWQRMDANGGKPPSDSPASYSDWYDVTFWANAIYHASTPLQETLDALQKVPAGADPSKNANFMKKRKKLQNAIGEVTHDTHAASEHGWPIAVMYTLSGGRTGAMLRARWNSVEYIPLSHATVLASPALAKVVAARAGGG